MGEMRRTSPPPTWQGGGSLCTWVPGGGAGSWSALGRLRPPGVPGVMGLPSCVWWCDPVLVCLACLGPFSSPWAGTRVPASQPLPRVHCRPSPVLPALPLPRTGDRPALPVPCLSPSRPRVNRGPEMASPRVGVTPWPPWPGGCPWVMCFSGVPLCAGGWGKRVGHGGCVWGVGGGRR